VSNLAVAAGAVAFTSSLPSASGARLDFWGVFLHVAPVAQAFKVFERVIQVIPVFVVNLTATFRSAAFTGLGWLQPTCVSGRDSTGDLFRAFPHRGTLAGEPAITAELEHIHVPTPLDGVRRILMFGSKDIQANWTSLWRVRDRHLLPIIMRLATARTG